MIAKLMKLLSGVAALVSRKPQQDSLTERLCACGSDSARRRQDGFAPPAKTVARPDPTEPLRALAASEGNLDALEGNFGSLRDTNAALIRERRELRKRLQRAESMSDADRGNEHAAELDRVKAILLDRHGLSVSRAQVASAVRDLSDRLTASRAVLRKLDRVVDVAGLTG